ncbi:hypothetical protein [Persicobacter psychrovividus]|uniref:Uncharacterized protein n=1 Tax=Persicobacter psychrovividus TaxID=387638 RepID=A0ABM7VLH9_9BACT|nr:hypothetical protein PEPS_41250 [Persicobacter psychrovividus]
MKKDKKENTKTDSDFEDHLRKKIQKRIVLNNALKKLVRALDKSTPKK